MGTTKRIYKKVTYKVGPTDLETMIALGERYERFVSIGY